MIEIKNNAVKQYYEYLNKSFNNQEFDKETRYNAHKKMQFIEALVVIYEKGEELSEEEWEDLKMEVIPVLPEEMKEIKLRLKSL